MKLLNTYLKYDGKITEEQFNQCIEIAKSLGYKVKEHAGIKVTYDCFIKNPSQEDGGYLRFSDGYDSGCDEVCVDNNSQKCKQTTLQDILNCKQSITFNYLIL